MKEKPIQKETVLTTEEFDIGLIPSEYPDGMDSEDVWDVWNQSQKKHFLSDHSFEPSNSSTRNFNALPDPIQEAIREHISSTRYADGGEVDMGVVKAIFDSNESGEQIQTSYGKKSLEGLSSMIGARDFDSETIAKSIFIMNSSKGKISTDWGDKTLKGLTSMIQGAREDGGLNYAEGGEIHHDSFNPEVHFQVVVNDDYDEPYYFKSFASAKKYTLANVKKQDNTIVSPQGDTIEVEKNQSKKDLDWLFKHSMAKGGYSYAEGGDITPVPTRNLTDKEMKEVEEEVKELRKKMSQNPKLPYAGGGEIAELEDELSKTNDELANQKRSDKDPNSPFIISLERKIKELEEEIGYYYEEEKYADGGEIGGGKLTDKIKVRYIEEDEIHTWTIEEAIDRINEDSYASEDNDLAYDTSDWLEGWSDSIEGEFYSLNDKNGKPLNKKFKLPTYADGGEIGYGAYILRLQEDAHDKVMHDLGFDNMQSYLDDLNQRGIGYAEFEEGYMEGEPDEVKEAIYTHSDDIVEELQSEGIAYKTYSGGYAKGGKTQGNSFGEVYDRVATYIMTDQNVDYDGAVSIIDTENKEGWIRDMVESEGETNAQFLAEQILTTDEGKYAHGGTTPEYHSPQVDFFHSGEFYESTVVVEKEDAEYFKDFLNENGIDWDSYDETERFDYIEFGLTPSQMNKISNSLPPYVLEVTEYAGGGKTFEEFSQSLDIDMDRLGFNKDGSAIDPNYHTKVSEQISQNPRLPSYADGGKVNGAVAIEKHPQGHWMLIDELSYQVGGDFAEWKDAYDYAIEQGIAIQKRDASGYWDNNDSTYADGGEVGDTIQIKIDSNLVNTIPNVGYGDIIDVVIVEDNNAGMYKVDYNGKTFPIWYQKASTYAEGGEIHLYGIYGGENNTDVLKEVYKDGQLYKGKAFFIDGYNGYTSTPDDGRLAIYDTKEKKYYHLKDKEGRHIINKNGRGKIINLSDYEKGGSTYAEGGEVSVKQRWKEVEELWKKYNYKPNQLVGGMGAESKPNSVVVSKWGNYNSLYEYATRLVNDELMKLLGSDYKGGVIIDVFSISKSGGFDNGVGYVLNSNGKNKSYIAEPESKIAYIVK